MPATIPVERLQLSNGITVLLVQNDTADIVAGRLLLRQAGSRWESAAEGGLFHLLSTVLTKGTEIRDAFQIAEAIESVGAALSADATSDYFGLAFKCVTPDFPDLIKLAAELLRSPTFPTNEIEREKYVTLQNIRSQQEQPFNVAFQQLRDGLYGDHPYARSVLGTEETVRGLGQSQLMTCHQQFFRPDNLVISLSGRLQRETVLDLLEAVFADWRSPAESMPTLQLPTPIARPDTFSLEQDSQQATVMLGYLAPSSHSPHYPVLKLVSSYLGSGLSSRLFVELREKQGLAYDVSAFYPTRLDESYFVTYMGTAPVNVPVAIAGLRQEVERLVAGQLTIEELDGAKSKLLGQYALGKQTNSEIAQVYGWYEILGLGIDYDQTFQSAIADITLGEIEQVATHYLQNPTLSVVGPGELALN